MPGAPNFRSKWTKNTIVRLQFYAHSGVWIGVLTLFFLMENKRSSEALAEIWGVITNAQLLAPSPHKEFEIVTINHEQEVVSLILLSTALFAKLGLKSFGPWHRKSARFWNWQYYTDDYYTVFFFNLLSF